MKTKQGKITNRILYFLLALVIDVAITFPVFFISIYMNPKTYHGNEGHNNGLVILCVTLPILVMVSRGWKRKNNIDAYNSSIWVLIMHVILFSTLLISEL